MSSTAFERFERKFERNIDCFIAQILDEFMGQLRWDV